MNCNSVDQCSFGSWYHQFKKLTFKSELISLSSQFVEYLLSDETIILPRSVEDSENESEAPSFPELDKKIVKSIQKLGGSVFPKLNWSSPKDASWSSLNNSLRCTIPADIYLLLKSSDFIQHDLSHCYQYCTDSDDRTVQYQLVLRKWIEINPSQEFRCFVQHRQLIGISQRDCSNYYPYMKQEQSTIVSHIHSYFVQNIQDKFTLDDYTFDVVRFNESTIKLVDFNPFGPTTDSILFDWDELKKQTERKAEDITPDLRYITNNTGVQPSPYRHYGLPVDAHDATRLMELVNLQAETEARQS